jgi:hypothetical protein
MDTIRTDLAAIRLFVFDHFLEHGTAPVVEQLMSAFDLSRAAAEQSLRDLEEARHIALVPGTARILMAFPFSAVTTPFRVIIEDRTYFANCAWDAIGFHAMLSRRNITVSSFCHHCAEPIEIEMRGGHAAVVDPPGTVVYLASPPSQWWTNIVATCGNTMVFFSSPEHRDASDLCTSPDSGGSLTPDQTHALSGPIFGHKFSFDYARPSREALLAHFAELGLTSDFWQL